MRKVALISIMLAFATGCASTNHNMDQADYHFPGIETTAEQAKAYLAELKLKKKRFKERQLLAKAAAFSDPDQIAANMQLNEQLASECEGISKGQWATSVRHGQDFLSYENHVEAMKRCFSEENKASLSDITTAMN